MKMIFKNEEWPKVLPEMRPLFPLHWQELGLDKETIIQDMDEDRYLAMHNLGMIHVTTARFNGRLVGYNIFFVMTHAHYKSAGLMAMADMYFILPEFRVGGAGAKMFMAAENSLRERGVVRMHSSCKVHEDHQKLFEALGWRWTDKTFSKLLRRK